MPMNGSWLASYGIMSLTFATICLFQPHHTTTPPTTATHPTTPTTTHNRHNPHSPHLGIRPGERNEWRPRPPTQPPRILPKSEIECSYPRSGPNYPESLTSLPRACQVVRAQRGRTKHKNPNDEVGRALRVFVWRLTHMVMLRQREKQISNIFFARRHSSEECPFGFRAFHNSRSVPSLEVSYIGNRSGFPSVLWSVSCRDRDRRELYKACSRGTAGGVVAIRWKSRDANRHITSLFGSCVHFH